MKKFDFRYSCCLSLLILIFIVTTLSACNMPRRPAESSADVEILTTRVAETVYSRLTQVALATQLVTPRASEGPTETATNIPTSAASPTNTPTSTNIPPTPTPVPCDRVEFVKDVSYPDNSEVPQGTSFIKTWRLKNAGACTWSTAYALVFTGGSPMGTTTSIPLPGYIAPGETVDLSVTLTAPTIPGTYRGDYKLRNATNVVFGIGPEDKSFYVQVKVPVATGLLLDFLSSAASAEWKSGVSSIPDTTLTFGGADDDPNGVAKVKENVALENGSTSNRILLTFPKHQDNGFISGLYQPYTVQDGDHFKARVGFMIFGGACGVGKVKFRLNYIEGSTLSIFKDWVKSCDGELLTIDTDLSSLKGKTVRFMLAVLTSGEFTDDWAVWSTPRIEH